MGSLMVSALAVFIGLGLIWFKPFRFIQTAEGKTYVSVLLASMLFAIAGYVMLTGMFFIANADKIYVVQWPTGRLLVVAEPGITNKLFGRVYEYDRVVAVATPAFVSERVDQGREESDDASTMAVEDRGSGTTVTGSIHPPVVRFNDAAKARVYGVIRVALPLDETGMLRIHREFGSDEALVDNVLRSSFRASALASARLMSIQEYITKRGSDFEDYFADQLRAGLYRTAVREEIVERATPEEPGSTGMQVEGAQSFAGRVRIDPQGRTIIETVEIQRDASGAIVRLGLPDVERYQLDIVTARITYVNPEKKVRDLIAKQRDAEARAALAENLRRASLLEAEAAEAEGQKKVAENRAAETAKQTQQTIAAETEKKIAVIARQKELEQADLEKQAEEIRVQTASLEATRIKTIADADAYKRRKAIEADDALQPKLDALVEVHGAWAEAYAKRNVPATVIGASSGSDVNQDAQVFQQMLNALVAKQIAVDPAISR